MHYFTGRDRVNLYHVAQFIYLIVIKDRCIRVTVVISQVPDPLITWCSNKELPGKSVDRELFRLDFPMPKQDRGCEHCEGSKHLLEGVQTLVVIWLGSGGSIQSCSSRREMDGLAAAWASLLVCQCCLSSSSEGA